MLRCPPVGGYLPTLFGGGVPTRFGAGVPIRFGAGLTETARAAKLSRRCEVLAAFLGATAFGGGLTTTGLRGSGFGAGLAAWCLLGGRLGGLIVPECGPPGGYTITGDVSTMRVGPATTTGAGCTTVAAGCTTVAAGWTTTGAGSAYLWR